MSRRNDASGRRMKNFTARVLSGSLEIRPTARKRGSTLRSSMRITGAMRRRSISRRREPGSYWPPALRTRQS